MRMNMNALNALKLKLAEYSKENGAIVEHVSLSMNRFYFNCAGNYRGSCAVGCSGACVLHVIVVHVAVCCPKVMTFPIVRQLLI